MVSHVERKWKGFRFSEASELGGHLDCTGNRSFLYLGLISEAEAVTRAGRTGVLPEGCGYSRDFPEPLVSLLC